MPRTKEQVGNLAYELYTKLCEAKFSYDELKGLGECIWAGAGLEKVNKGAVIKLWKVAAALDAIYPLPEEAPVAVVVQTAAQPAAQPTSDLPQAAVVPQPVRAAALTPEVVEPRRLPVDNPPRAPRPAPAIEVGVASVPAPAAAAPDAPAPASPNGVGNSDA